jgi:bromodomain-containing factor 1
MDTQGSEPNAQAPVASESISADDANAAPVTQVSSGISAVASFLPATSADSAPEASKLTATTTVPPHVEQPLSDVRAELAIDESPPVAEATTEEPSTKEFAALDVNSAADTKVVVDADPEQPAPIASEEFAVEDKMDTTEDIVPASSHVLPTSEHEPVSTTEVSAVEDTPIPDAAVQGSGAAPEATSGQVRQREDDDEDEPSAKRAKTETAEGSPEITAPVATSAEVPTPSAEPEASLTPAAPSASALAPPPQWDTNPLTPIQHKYLLEQVRKAKKVKFGLWFLKPVDPVALNIPTYPDIIKKPMDLGTLEEKLKKNEYATASDFMADFNLIIDNCITFNGAAHSVSQTALNLRAYFNKNISLMPTGDAAKPPVQPAKPKKVAPVVPKKPEPRPERVKAPVAVARSPVEPKNVGYVTADGMPIIRRTSSAGNGPVGDRPKRAIHPPKRDLPHPGSKPKKKKHQVELKFCELVVNEMFKKKHAAYAYPFLHPVDPVALNIPHYHKIIKKPMDFGTIQTNLKNSQYSNAKEFLVDARLVFQNCFKFNIPNDEVYKMGKAAEELFEETWKGKDQYLIENNPPSEPVSDAEDEDEEDDDDEEVDDEDKKHQRMLEIQRQIAALSAEAMKLTTEGGKRSSPKAAGKKAKSKAAPGKARRTNSAAIVAAKPAKPKAKVRVRKLSLEQKRQVSEGIANLDESQMRRAVQIIRNGVPSLRVC